MWLKRKNKTVEETFKENNIQIDNQIDEFELEREKYARQTSSIIPPYNPQSGINSLDNYYKNLTGSLTLGSSSTTINTNANTGLYINDPTRTLTFGMPTINTSKFHGNKILSESEINRLIEFFTLTGTPIPEDIKRILGIPYHSVKVTQEKRPKKRLKI